MKTRYLVMLLVLVMGSVGCAKEPEPEKPAKPAKPINMTQKLYDRDGVWLHKDTDEPYTGEVYSLSKGRTLCEGMLKDGLREGHWEVTFKDSQTARWTPPWGPKYEGTFRLGKAVEVRGWLHPSGKVFDGTNEVPLQTEEEQTKGWRYTDADFKRDDCIP